MTFGAIWPASRLSSLAWGESSRSRERSLSSRGQPRTRSGYARFRSSLAANGGGAIVNMLSVTSFYNNPLEASSGVSKAAEWSLTNGIRTELAHQGT